MNKIKNKIKVASIVCAWPPVAGGIGNSAYQINQLLSDRAEITNFTPGKNIRPWLQKGHGAFLPQLLWRLKDFDYLYLHYPFFGTSEIIYLFKKLHKKKPKLIIHYHMDVKNNGLLSKILSLPSRIIRYSLLNQADIIVTASLDYIKHSQIRKYYFAHPEKFREIPFSLDLQKFQPKSLNQSSNNGLISYAQKIVHYVNNEFIKKNQRQLLFVGGLDRAHYFKGLEVLFIALSNLKTKNWKLVIVGEGDRRRHYEKLSEKLALTKKIEFRGKLSATDLIRTYQEADLLLLPSINTNEAFGLVIIEALACGVPVIASNLPGVRQVFNNGQEGLLVNPGNSEDLKNKLEFILNHENYRQKMAKAAHQLAEKRYDQEKIKKDLESLFN